MANKFRNLTPVRTCTKEYRNYRSYKPYISKDFNYRCGYTDCPDSWFGGTNNFHIDHFKPFSKNPELETLYANLVYCCSYVNILKSDDESEYIDPCNIDFNLHFERDTEGRIIPKSTSPVANYMHQKLKLFLSRYSLIWKLEEIRERIKKLTVQIHHPKNELIKNDLRVLHSELSEEFFKYFEYLNTDMRSKVN